MSGIIDTLCEKYSHDYQRMADALDRALHEMDRLRLENANLRAENRHLRRLLSDRDLRLLRRAQRDALFIGALHYSGAYTSKRECASLGMGENRWSLARVLLRRADLLRKDGVISMESADDFEAAVNLAVQRIYDLGDANALTRGSYRHKPRQRRAPAGASTGATNSATNSAASRPKPLHQSSRQRQGKA